MIIKIIVLMSLCAVIAFRKHFKKRALFVIVLIVAICANIFIPAFEFFFVQSLRMTEYWIISVKSIGMTATC